MAASAAVDTLDGAVAVLTGAGSGIGRATALRLADAGARVVVSDLDPGRAEAVAREVDGFAVTCDVARDGDVTGLRDRVLDAHGRVDVVMSNVGILARGYPEQLPLAAWQRSIDVNLLGTVRVLDAFLPTLLAQGAGHLVTTASTAGLFPYAYDRLPYTATKAAVVAMSEALALYLRPRGIGVTCLCPAGVLTNIVEQITDFGDPPPIGTPQVPLSTPEEVADRLVRAVLADELLITSHPDADELDRRHAQDRQAFLHEQIGRLP